MIEHDCDVIVAGAGPAGMAAALTAARQGAEVLLIEREKRLGGILNQCIHDGFGGEYFGELLTGPEYAGRFAEKVQGSGKIHVLANALITRMDADKQLWCSMPQGLVHCHANAVILAMGCYERTRGGIAIAGTRPAGVYTAGVVQRMINVENIAIGKRAVILGSGDIGMIMARRLALEGVEVLCVLEKLSFCSGLQRNVHQCLNDYGIPLYLSQTVTKILGDGRLCGVVVSKLDEKGQPLPGEDYTVACDTLVLSVGLIPETALAREAGVKLHPVTKGILVDSHMQTSVPGIFACGNMVHVNDLADNVSVEGEIAGNWAAQGSRGEPMEPVADIAVKFGAAIRYVVPDVLVDRGENRLSLRVSRLGRNQTLQVRCAGKTLLKRKIPNATPAEMLCVTLPPLDGDTREIEVEIE